MTKCEGRSSLQLSQRCHIPCGTSIIVFVSDDLSIWQQMREVITWCLQTKILPVQNSQVHISKEPRDRGKGISTQPDGANDSVAAPRSTLAVQRGRISAQVEGRQANALVC